MTNLDTSFAAVSAPASELAQAILARTEGVSGGIKKIMEGRSDVFQINPFFIEVDPDFNGRDFSRPEVQEHVDSLARSIAAVGLRRALRVRNVNNKFILVDGECRLRAIHRAINVYGAEIRTVKVELQDRFSNDAHAALAQITDNSGLRFTPLEQIKPLKRMFHCGWTIKDIADAAGMTAPSVTRIMELDALPEEVKTMIRDGKVSATTAQKLFKEMGEDADATVLALVEGMEAAEAAGSEKVRPRHVSAGRASTGPKAPKINKELEAIRAAFVGATLEVEVEEDADDASVSADRHTPLDDSLVMITMNAAKFEAIRALLNL